MKVLQLFSNYKFTGPADPALILAAELQRIGDDVRLAVGQAPNPEIRNPLLELAKQRGIPLLADPQRATSAQGPTLELRKHGQPLPLWRDLRRLRRHLQQEPVDVIHAHQANDHLLAVLAANKGDPPVVRTWYDAHPPTGFRSHVILPRTAALLTFDGAVRDEIARRWPRVRVDDVDPVVDLQRFPENAPRDYRRHWGLEPHHFVIGVVARMQRHRLFPQLIEGFAQVAREHSDVQMVILGRGTHQETVAKEPARQSGVSDQIHFPGYVEPDDYPKALPTFDALVFLVPGSDGTCRAAREALVCGVPVIASRRGLLPNFIEENTSGLLLPSETPAAMAQAMATLYHDRALRDRLALGAARRGRTRFDASAHARHVHALYQELLTQRREQHARK